MLTAFQLRRLNEPDLMSWYVYCKCMYERTRASKCIFWCNVPICFQCTIIYFTIYLLLLSPLRSFSVVKWKFRMKMRENQGKETGERKGGGEIELESGSYTRLTEFIEKIVFGECVSAIWPTTNRNWVIIGDLALSLNRSMPLCFRTFHSWSSLQVVTNGAALFGWFMRITFKVMNEPHSFDTIRTNRTYTHTVIVHTWFLNRIFLQK